VATTQGAHCSRLALTNAGGGTYTGAPPASMNITLVAGDRILSRIVAPKTDLCGSNPTPLAAGHPIWIANADLGLMQQVKVTSGTVNATGFNFKPSAGPAPIPHAHPQYQPPDYQPTPPSRCHPVVPTTA